MKLRNILLLVSVLPSLAYGIGLDFSSLKPSSPEIQINTFNETKKDAVTTKNRKKVSKTKSSKIEIIDCEERAKNYLKEAYPELEFTVSSVIETEGFYTTTVNFEQSKNNRKINNAFVNVNVDKRTGFIYNTNLAVWEDAWFDKEYVESELSEKKTKEVLIESLIDLSDYFKLLEDSSKDQWDKVSVIKVKHNQFVINNIPFSKKHTAYAKKIITVKKDTRDAYGIYAWEFTFFYNGVYNVISYDFKNKKPINGFEIRNNIKYMTYPFSRFDKYELQEVSNINNLYFSPNGWHKIDDEYNTHVTIGNNVKVLDYATKYSFNGGDNFEFDGTNCKKTKDCKDEFNKDITLTSMFYIGNTLHDIFYNLGFNEKMGNFQENNFEKGGKGNDSMIIYTNFEECTEEQRRMDESCDNGVPSSSATIDGVPGVIMVPPIYNFRDDRWINAGVINHILIHEYTHAVHARYNGGPNFDCGLVASSMDFAALAEGYADFFSAALQFYKKKNIDRNTTVVLDNLHNTDNVITCDNNLKYSDLKVMADTEDGYYGGNIWKTILYDAFYNIVEYYPSTDDYLQVFDDDSIPGNVLFLKIVLEGLKISGCNPTFLRARNGIIYATEKNKYTENDKKYQCLVWKAFADRGLGINAVEPVVLKNKDKNGKKDYLYMNNHDLPKYCIDILKNL